MKTNKRKRAGETLWLGQLTWANKYWIAALRPAAAPLSLRGVRLCDAAARRRHFRMRNNFDATNFEEVAHFGWPRVGHKMRCFKTPSSNQ